MTSNKNEVILRGRGLFLIDPVLTEELCEYIIFRSLQRFQDQFEIHGFGEKRAEKRKMD